MITVTLVGGVSPQLVQVVVDVAPVGEAWTLTGSTGTFEWTVPGGVGVGDGNQLALVDNRSPLNVPITYTFTSESGVETSAPITVVQLTGDVVFQSLDGQKSVDVELREGSDRFSLEPSLALFRIPGRRRPVARFTATSDIIGELHATGTLEQTPAIDELLATGEPLLFRLTAPALDLPLVTVLAVTSIGAQGFLVGEYRHWDFSYVLLDDPYMDQRLGAFSWDYFDDTNSARDWDDFDALFAASTWDQFDVVDWSTL